MHVVIHWTELPIWFWGNRIYRVLPYSLRDTDTLHSKINNPLLSTFTFAWHSALPRAIIKWKVTIIHLTGILLMPVLNIIVTFHLIKAPVRTEMSCRYKKVNNMLLLPWECSGCVLCTVIMYINFTPYIGGVVIDISYRYWNIASYKTFYPHNSNWRLQKKDLCHLISK